MSWERFCLLGMMPVLVATLVASSTFAVEPVIHYTFEDSLANSGTGGSKYDAKVYTTKEKEDSASSNGSISYVAGQKGKALDITNTQGDKYGTFIGVEYAMPKQGTIAMWYYAGKSGKFYNHEPLFDGIEAPVEPDAVNSYSENIWEAWIYRGGMLRGRIHFRDEELQYFNAVCADLNALGGCEKWYHIAMTWDTSDTSQESLKLYVDGQLSSTAPLGWAPPPKILCFAGGNALNCVSTGTFDEVQIYESPLPAPEIAKLAGSKPVTVPKPVLHYKFEGNLKNSGSAGDKLDGIHVKGVSGEIAYTPGVNGKGLSYRNEQGSETDGDFVKVNYKLADKGAISVWYKPRAGYNYNTIWDNSTECDDWECWVYWDSKVRARVGRYVGGACSQNLNEIQEFATGSPEYWEDGWYLITFTWSRSAGTSALYVNGKLAEAQKFREWIVPGDAFYLGGGQDENQYGVGIFDDLMIFEDYLTSAQVRNLFHSVLPTFEEEKKE